VYEVVRLYDGVPFTLTEHMDRLSRSAAAIDIPVPLSPARLASEIRSFIRTISAGEGMIYLQLTRGVGPRNHIFTPNMAPTLLFYFRPLPKVLPPGTAPGVKLMTVDDERWKRCWIKAIALLPNVLAKNQAVQQGYDEAAFVEDGRVNECSASNLFIVSGKTVITHPVGPKVLPGITRAVLLQCAAEIDIPVEERPIPIEEAVAADEIFITSTTREISWAVQWNDAVVGAGVCGPVALALHKRIQQRVREETASAKEAERLKHAVGAKG
jgi:D-alanine transaminase